MSTSKHMTAVCIAAAVFAVIIACAMLIAGTSGAFGAGEGKQLGYEDKLFDTSVVHEIDIEMDDWDGFLSTCTSEEYSPCSITIDGETYDVVGIRGKGNTSMSTVSSLGSDRYSFKVEFGHYSGGVSYHGLDKISLNNTIQDTTYMKDYLTYRAMAEFGVDAPLCSFAWIRVNGEDWGLYLVVEGVENSFLQRNYGSDYGELYKPDSMSFGGGRGNGAGFDMGEFEFDEDGELKMGATTDSDGEMTGFSGFSGEAPDSSGAMPGFSGEAPNSGGAMPGFSGEAPNSGGAMPGFSGEAPDSGGAMPGFGGGFSGFSGEAPNSGGAMPGFSGEAPNSGGEMPDFDGFSGEAPDSSGAMPDFGGGFFGFGGEAPGSGEGMSGSGGGMPGFGGMGSDDVKLQYIDDDPDSYANIFDNAKTTISAADENRLIASLKQLSNYENIDEIVDIDEVIRYFVVHDFVCNGDSYTGSMVHNYYLYEDDGQLSMIPWDYNLAYGTFQATDATATVNDPIDTPVSGGNMDDRPMVGWIFSNDEYTDLYHELYARFLDEVDLQAIIDETAALIDPYVQKDPTAFYSYEDFKAGVETLKEFCALRAESVLGQLGGTIPSTKDGQSADSSALVDASAITLSDMGSMGGGGQPGNMGGGGQPGNMPFR